MKFCKSCGSQLEDIAMFCPNCGSTQEAAQPSTPPVQNTQPDPFPGGSPTPVNPALTEAKKKSNATIIGIIAVSVVALLAVIFILSSLVTPAYEKPIQYFITGMNKQSFKTMLKALPPYEAEDMEEYLDYYYDDDESELWEELEDEFDGKYKISYEITSKKKLSSKKLESYVDDIDYYYDEDYDVTAGYTIKAKVTIKYDGEKETEKVEFTVLKMNGKWYIYDAGDFSLF